MAVHNLRQRTVLLQDSLKQTAHLITKLSKTQASVLLQPVSEIAASVEEGSRDTHASLSAEIQEALNQDEEELELLQQDLEDLEPIGSVGLSSRRSEGERLRASEREREYVQLSATCRRILEDLKLSRIRFRKAQLQAKKNREIALQKEQLAYIADLQAIADVPGPTTENGSQHDQSQSQMRNSLLRAGRRTNRLNDASIKEDVLLNASSDLTTSLRRTHDLLTSEVSRSRFAQDTLAASNSALEELNKRYGTLDDLLSRSRGLLGSLLRSQKSDTWYLETALYILLGTVIWLLFRRLLYGPAWWFIWQPLKLLWYIVGKLGAVVGLKRLSPGAASVTVPAIVTVEASGYPMRTVPGPPILEQATPSGSLSEIVSTIIDNTRAVSTTASSESDKQDEHPDSPGKPGNEDQARRDADTQPQGTRRGDGTKLEERDPKKDPPNPKKRMWEEPKGRDEL